MTDRDSQTNKVVVRGPEEAALPPADASRPATQGPKGAFGPTTAASARLPLPQSEIARLLMQLDLRHVPWGSPFLGGRGGGERGLYFPSLLPCSFPASKRYLQNIEVDARCQEATGLLPFVVFAVEDRNGPADTASTFPLAVNTHKDKSLPHSSLLSFLPRVVIPTARLEDPVRVRGWADPSLYIYPLSILLPGRMRFDQRSHVPYRSVIYCSHCCSLI